MNRGLIITLKSVVRSLNEAHKELEQNDYVSGEVASKVFFASARVENVLVHLDQNEDVEHAEEEKEYEALFRSAGL